MEPALLVMAAGMGARYGGLKQIDPIGPNGEIIIEYSIYDALRAGFSKLIFVIRHCFEKEFREKIGGKFNSQARIGYAFQELDTGTSGFVPPPDREKPWGTGHAVLVANDLIEEPFAVINADDYYGPNSMKLIADFLSSKHAGGEDEHAMVGFTLRNTLSEYGRVARGICECDESMYLRRVVEYPAIEKKGRRARAFGSNGLEHLFSGDEIVSMNLWGFQPSIFGHLQAQFSAFLRCHGHNPDAEFYIPSAVDELVRAGEGRIKVLKTGDAWFGVTYKEDRAIAETAIRNLIAENVYPENLWETG
jgi:UTP-glucose-1-phosphate uridylyltransferase